MRGVKKRRYKATHLAEINRLRALLLLHSPSYRTDAMYTEWHSLSDRQIMARSIRWIDAYTASLTAYNTAISTS